MTIASCPLVLPILKVEWGEGYIGYVQQRMGILGTILEFYLLQPSKLKRGERKNLKVQEGWEVID